MENKTIPSWDGTYLGHLECRASVKMGKRKVVHLAGQGYDFLCVCRCSLRASIVCLVDELKPLLSVEKIGTNSAHINGRLCVLIRMPAKGGGFFLEDTLADCAHARALQTNSAFRAEMQKIVLFRNIAAIERAGDSSILVRDGRPIAWMEATPKAMAQISPIPSTTECRWFDDAPNDVLLQMFAINDEGDISPVVNAMRERMTQCMQRIDPGLDWFVDQTVGRFAARLR